MRAHGDSLAHIAKVLGGGKFFVARALDKADEEVDRTR